MTDPRPVVIDTDTFNEIDDQFAVAHALLSDGVDVQALYAAPFVNDRAASAEDGMLASHAELGRLLDRLGGVVPDPPPVLTGARAFLDDDGPTPSDAAHDLVERSRAMPDGVRLTVVAIGAPTNVATALLLDPTLGERLDVVWLGGHGFDWPTAREFNLEQDLRATRTLLEAAGALVLVPCFPVASHLLVTRAELVDALPRSPLVDFLLERFTETTADHRGYARALWDVAATAAVVDPGAVLRRTTARPALAHDLTWDASRPGRDVAVVYGLDRNRVVAGLLRALARTAR